MLPATGQKGGEARERGQVEPGVYVDTLLGSKE